MTKEELEKEAEEFTDSKKSFWRQGRTCIDSVKQAYIASAEPREKRIAELERNVAYYAERAKHAELDGRDIVLKNKELGKRCLQLQKDKGNLTDKVRDLEEKLANADYQLEGRDLEIKELKAQIEKMKNCKNCKKLKKEKDGLLICTVGRFYINTFGENCDKWEMKENDRRRN